eukprot:COSAG02_NODE_1162_length_14168_cov_10.478570_6_plen_853_part_00
MDEQKNKVYSNPVLAALCKIWGSSLHPYGQFHSVWDVMILCLVFFSAVWEPMKAGFFSGEMSWWEWCIDITFYVDIILAFWTGYDCGFEIVTDKRMIASRYLKGWFIIDAGATIEWDLIVGFLLPATNTSVVRLCKLIKIARLARASRLINRLTSTWTINTAYIEAIKFFVYVLICAHILACFFFMFPGLVGDNVDESVCRCYRKIGEPGYGEDNCADPAVQYGTCTKAGQVVDRNQGLGTSKTSSEENGALTHDNLITAYPAGNWIEDRHCPDGTWDQVEYACTDGTLDQDALQVDLQTECTAAGGVWLPPPLVDTWFDFVHSKQAAGYDKNDICADAGYEEDEDPETGRVRTTCENMCLDHGNVWEPARGGSGPWAGDTEAYCGDMPHIFSCSWRLMRGGSDGMVGDLPLPTSQYLQSMYWSMTTMTTIGYGDRFPNTEAETVLCMVCEIIGLSFFALLLTQINNLNDVLGKTVQDSNDIKNEIVGFMKYNDLPFSLIEDVIHYLNFKASSISGLYFEDDDPRFESLSVELKKLLKIRLLTPALQRVKMFGYSKEDEKERERVRVMFQKTDTDNGGFLDKDEIHGLTKRLKIEFTPEQLNQAMNEMDPDGNNEVGFEEFESWWFLKRNGVRRQAPAPIPFLQELAATVVVSACSPSDPILECGEYGTHLHIVLTGSAEVVQRDPLWREGKTEHEVIQRSIRHDHREPVFGLPALLERPSDRQVLAKTTQEWFARASKTAPDGFCDIAVIEGSVVRALVQEHWKEDENDGTKIWLAVAKNQYHSIWHEEELENAHRRASVSGLGANMSEAERIAALEKRVDQSLEQLRKEVDTTIGAIGSKLDALIANQAG